MNVYFEFPECVVNQHYHSGKVIPARYCAVYDLPRGVKISSRLLAFADRAWIEDDHAVDYIKHRGLPVEDAVVDLKEFFWVKLRSLSL